METPDCSLMCRVQKPTNLWSAWSVRLLVTFSSPAKPAELIEMLCGWLTRVDPRTHVLDGVQIPQGEGHFLGFLQPSEKHRKSLLGCTQQKINSSKQQRDCCTRLHWLLTGRCHSNFSQVTNPPSCDVAFSQNSLTTFCFTIF